ncbi:MAG: putative Ig domain-containing protein [Planctomycetes bacterium]|nr:putative Ig domain-containing protein [Planctomycetota bacterium]
MLSSNVTAQLLGGSLYLTDYSAGSRSLQVAQDTRNPALFTVTPGAGTRVNGLTTAAHFLVSQLSSDINITMNDGGTGSGSTDISINGSGLTIRGNLTVNVLGKGPDTIRATNAAIGASLFVCTNDGADQLLLSQIKVGMLTNIMTGAGPDTVTIQKSTFNSCFNLDGGLQGGDTLNVDDSTFHQAFCANMCTSGNTINVERDTSLPGSTTFLRPASFNYLGVLQRGGGGNINVATHDPASQVYFASAATFLAANVQTSVLGAHFNGCSPNYIWCTRAGIEITTASLPDWTQNQTGYSQIIHTDGGIGPLTFSVSAGALPVGFSINPTTGLISGTPTNVQTAHFTVLVIDANGPSDAQQYTVHINAPLQITTTSLVDWTQNLAGFNQPIATSGGTPAITFTVSTGTLPSGLNLNPSTGVISGTPNLAGVSHFTIRATDAAGSADTHDYAVTINPLVTITTTSLSDGTLNNYIAYSQTVATTGGTGSITFSLGAGRLPDGLTLDGSTGQITGRPTLVGTFNFTIVATDSLGATDSKPYSVVINDALVITTTSLPNPTKDVFYSTTIQSVGGTAPVQYTLYGGVLPTGL